jgi:hypothetical protein
VFIRASRLHASVGIVVASVLTYAGGHALHPVLDAAQTKSGQAAAACDGPNGSQSPTTNVTATDQTGATLAADPLLNPTRNAIVSVSGFAAGADVEVWLANATTKNHQSADANGVLSYSLTIAGLADGQYSLLFQGAFPGMHSATGGGNVMVSVPRIGIFPFGVTCAQTVPAALTLKLKAKPVTVAVGQKVTLTATATQSGQVVPGAPLVLWSSVARGAWKKSATATTNARGVATFVQKPKYSTRYQVRYTSSAIAGIVFPSTTSSAVAVAVTSKVSIKVPSNAPHSAKERVTVTIAPKQRGRLVYLVVGGKRVAHARTDKRGKVVFTVTFAPGRHKVRAYVAATKQYGTSVSKTYIVTGH